MLVDKARMSSHTKRPTLPSTSSLVDYGYLWRSENKKRKKQKKKKKLTKQKKNKKKRKKNKKKTKDMCSIRHPRMWNRVTRKFSGVCPSVSRSKKFSAEGVGISELESPRGMSLM